MLILGWWRYMCSDLEARHSSSSMSMPPGPPHMCSDSGARYSSISLSMPPGPSTHVLRLGSSLFLHFHVNDPWPPRTIVLLNSVHYSHLLNLKLIISKTSFITMILTILHGISRQAILVSSAVAAAR